MTYDKYEFIHDLMKLLNVSEPKGELKYKLEDIFDKISKQATEEIKEELKEIIGEHEEPISDLKDQLFGE